MLGCGTKLFTTGFSKLSERQLALWDMVRFKKKKLFFLYFEVIFIKKKIERSV